MMNEILMTNIFFAITAFASVITLILLTVLLVYIIRLVKKIHTILDFVQEETLKVIDDVEEVREVVRNNLSYAKNVISAAFVKKLIEKLLFRQKK